MKCREFGSKLCRSLQSILLVLLLVQAHGAFAVSCPAGYPKARTSADYAAEKSCTDCHAEQGKSWQASKHSRAMQPANSNTVAGDFQDRLFTGVAGDTIFHKKGEHFTVETMGSNGQKSQNTISHTLGVYPLQQYLVEQAGGRLQAFTIAWDTIRNRWFDLQAEEPARPGTSLHWTGRYQNWNLMCAECHTTGYRKAYDENADCYQTTWTAPNVGCQACHGPGEKHVLTIREKKSTKYPGYGLPFKAGQVDQCAACHSRRTRLLEETQPGGEFLDNYQPDSLRQDLYHADGQQMGEVFEYGSFRQSRMYEKGVVCSDCHSVHGGKLIAEGNALCVRCHSPSPNPAFPSLKARRYDDPQHHFHSTGQPGSQCVDCHMPSQNYMVVHGRRDHAIRIPRPDLSATLGTPNACGNCHKDRDTTWAAAEIAKRSGKPTDSLHYGEIFAAARRGEVRSLGPLAGLALDSHQPAIVRATATEMLGQLAPSSVPPAVIKDPDPAVRSSAAMALGAAPTARVQPLLLSLLDDPVLAVRMAAARSLVPFGKDAIPERRRASQKRSLAAFVAAQQAMADMPATQLNLGNLYLQLDKPEKALVHYRRALRQDPEFVAARLELAEWMANNHRFDEAETLLREGMRKPGSDEMLRAALIDLLVRQGKQEEARRERELAVTTEPDGK
ncbi:MAG: hypothetical protein FD131_4126 [Rhodocyclaceae bacterium]|nr:MAG: hypothetical protein FD131_4126 [Rhodocyclaceae bacterium]